MGQTMYQAFDSVRSFEKCVAEYAGSRFAVSVDNCTNAIFLCCKYLKVGAVTIPARNYCGVAAAILHAGGQIQFEHVEWRGAYQLKPYPIIDSAMRFRRGMYMQGTLYCLSFNIIKHLKIGKGGMILMDDPEAYKWFKSARYLGRHENPCHNEDCHCTPETIDMVGWNMHMTPDQASRGLSLMHRMPDHNDDLYFTYPDLSTYDIFKKETYEMANRTPT
ncbi:MAG: DegT/DnrJ/EryC1/StrS family aminotransferase [Deltaproteobacteria bacterium]|nr:DegT/DnrJ/EryC1/StrS family aminotransferase [Deltaproteobacteria bacterium]